MAYIIDAVDQEKSINGVWYEYEGGEFLVARGDNQRTKDRVEVLRKPHRRKIERGEASDIIFDITLQAMAETILLDWKNVMDSQGNEVPYSSEKAFIALKNSREFREAVSGFAGNESNYFKDVLEK